MIAYECPSAPGALNCTDCGTAPLQSDHSRQKSLNLFGGAVWTAVLVIDRWLPLVGEGVAAGMPQHVGWALSSRPAAAAARSIIWARPAVVNGEQRSLNMKGDDGLARLAQVPQLVPP
jgi:hypothetical protein